MLPPGDVEALCAGPSTTWSSCWPRPGRSPTLTRPRSRPVSGWPVWSRTGHPAGQPARPARPPDRQGPPGPAGRVRVQAQVTDTDTDDGGRLHPAPGQPGRRPAVGTRGRPSDHPHRPQAPHGDRRPRLRRGGPARSGNPDRGHPPRGQTRPGPPSPRTSTIVPPDREMANRVRGDGSVSSKRGYGWDRTRLDGINGAQNLDRTRRPDPTTMSRSPSSPPDRPPRTDLAPPQLTIKQCPLTHRPSSGRSS